MIVHLVRLLVFVLLLNLCACLPASDPNRSATAQAIGQAVRTTATAEALTAQQPKQAVVTAQAEATSTILKQQATQAAVTEVAAGDQAATQAALAPFQAELPRYGVNPAQGHLGGAADPVTLQVSGYRQYAYATPFQATPTADLVISADITWNTQYGTAGCGFVLRSDGKQNAWNQYLVLATRGASGHVLFATMANGQVVGGRDLYAYGKDKSFQWENDTTNRLTVVGRGTLFSIYTNGVLIGEVDPTAPAPPLSLPPPPSSPDLNDPALQARYQEQLKQYETVKAEILAQFRSRRQEALRANKKFDRGFAALTVLSESGQTTCHFDNTWLWLLN